MDIDESHPDYWQVGWSRNKMKDAAVATGSSDESKVTKRLPSFESGWHVPRIRLDA